MNIIFNDFSINEQFNNLDEFIESISNDTLPAMRYLEEKGEFLLFKSKAIFEKNICPNVSFGYFFNKQSFGIPELARFKSLLVQLLGDPFWEEDISTEVEAIYNCATIGEFLGSEPTCFSEAIERCQPLLSLRHSDYSESSLIVEKNNKQYFAANMFHKESVCEFLLDHGQIGLSEYLLRKNYPIQVSFLHNDNLHYYADSCLEKGEITIDDVKNIAETFERHITNLHNGISSKLTKSINHNGFTYFEFRDKLSQRREFRIFYYRKESKLIYLNSLLKKTPTTPDFVKDYSVKLIKKITLY